MDALQRVLAAPDDERAREDFATEVEATDPLRAEFVRCQLLTARDRREHVERIGSYSREQVLREQHGQRWAAPVDGFVSGWAFLRGFVEHVSVDAEWFTEVGEELYARAPILHLNLEDVNIALDYLFESPYLARIQSLSVARNELTDDAVAALAASPFLGELRWLDLAGNQIGPAGLESLAASTNLPKLGYVNVSNNPVEDPTPRFADEYGATGSSASSLMDRHGHRDWLDARPRAVWPPPRDAVD